MTASTPPSAIELRAAFDAAPRLTIGLEEECLLLDPGTLEAAPRAAAVLERAAIAGAPVKAEMPAAQLEIETPPGTSVPEVVAALAAGREALLLAADGIARPAALPVHPFSAVHAEISTGARYETILAEYGRVARVQLVGSLQVHVAVGGADATLAVHDALRSHLPEIAALAAGAPCYAGLDTGLASVRPKLCDLLPQQGVPDPIGTWEHLGEAWRWGAASGAVPDPGAWWWELRTHPSFGTLELRVPDVQPTVAAAGAVAAYVHCLVAWLLERHESGETLPVDPTWRIAHNRWSACRHGIDGSLADLRTGERTPTRTLLAGRLETFEPFAGRLGCTAELADADDLLASPIAARHRAAYEEGGPHGVAAWAADAYGTGLDRAVSRLTSATGG